jgi:hypothetical protein
MHRIASVEGSNGREGLGEETKSDASDGRSGSSPNKWGTLLELLYNG